MFAVAMTPAFMVGAAAGLGALAMLISSGVGIYAVQKIRARRAATGGAQAISKKAILPGLFGAVSSAASSPLVKEVEKVVVQAIHDSQHAALNTAVAKMLPPLAPFIPLIDQVADLELAKIAGQPLQPAAPTVIHLPIGHPVLDLLQKVLEASVNQQQSAATSKG